MAGNNQADYQKIKAVLLDPLAKVFGGFDDVVAEVIVEDCSHYPETVLREAVKHVIRKQKSIVRPAHVLKACAEAAVDARNAERAAATGGSGRYNYSQPSNGMICLCGGHHGVGDLSPDQRAARYARMRDMLPDFIQPHMREYLKSWEKIHGIARWELGPEVKTKDGSYRTTHLI